jgi:oligopeptide/dipeptide ABC transporter ATP-binding protein
MTVDSTDELLTVEGLSMELNIGGESFNALRDVSFSLRSGEAIGLVGESGSGKSLSLRAILGLLPPSAHITSGRMVVAGEEFDLTRTGRENSRRIARLRGSSIAMIFQEPAVALNPVVPVGKQIVDAVARRKRMGKRAARDYALHLMDLVGIHDASTKIDAYPFELSGGLKQRVMIAAAVAGEPQVILCDEPTTALDVTVQKQILSLFTHLRDELHASLLYVTHDLAVVAQLCDSVTLLSSGEVMESSDDLRAVFDGAQHPYTEALLRSTPDVDRIEQRLYSIPGSAASLRERSGGCQFATRCEYARDDCRTGSIPDTSGIPGRVVRCLHKVGAPADGVAVGGIDG